jgi:HEAT repeat protein
MIMNSIRLLVVLVAFAAFGTAIEAADLAELVNKAPDADRDGKYTGPSREDAEVLYKEVLKDGADGVCALAKLLSDAGDGSDYKARYAVHGLCIYVGQEGKEKERKAVGDGLMTSLKGAPPDIATFLIGELHYLVERRAVPVLAEYLTDAKLYEPAVRALVTIREGAAEPIRKALAKAQGRNKLALIQALGRLRDVESCKAIVPSLSAGDSDERTTAAEALAAIGCVDAIGPVLQHWDKAKGFESTRAADACFRLAANLVAANKNEDAGRIYDHVWKSLADRNEPHLRYAVVQGLAGSLANQPTDALVKQMKQGDPALRAAVLHVFARSKDPAAFDAVVAAAKDKDIGVRLLAIGALGPVGGPKAIPILVSMLPGEGEEMQEALYLALVAVPGNDINAALAKALSGLKDNGARMAMLAVISQRRVREAAPEILKLAADDDEGLRLRALETLAKVATGDVASGLAELLPKVKEGREQQALTEALVVACSNIGDKKARLKPLFPAIENGEPKQRCLLLAVAGRIDTDESRDQLVKTLKDDNAEVQNAAMRALEEFPSKRALNVLLEIAKSTQNEKHQVMALRGYMRLVNKEGEDKRVALIEAAIPAIKRPDQQNLIFGSLGNIRRKEALALAMKYVPDENLRKSAAAAAINITRKMKGKDRAAAKASMAKLLEQVQDKGLRRKAQDAMK